MTSCSYSKATKQSTPKKSSFKLFNKKPQAQETEEHTYSVITTAEYADRPRATEHSPSLYPAISNPVSPPHQIQMQIHQTEAEQQQPHHINTQTLLRYSVFLSNTTLQPPTFIPAPPRAPQPELNNYSNTPQLSTQPIIFADNNKIHSSELAQPTHTVSNITDTPQDISLISDTSISDPHSSQFVFFAYSITSYE